VEAEKLSEVVPSSDGFGSKTGKAVRSSPQVQTGLAGKEEKLSEVAPSSDRFGRERGKAVRSSAKFRQVWQEKRISCQK
jgi:hypothetical protein